jgi:hypothetical protein
MKRFLNLLLICVSLSISGWTVERFDWNTIINFAPRKTSGGNSREGFQVLHFGSHNKPYEKDSKAVDFVKQYLSAADALTSDAEVLRVASDSVTLQGLYLQIGVKRYSRKLWLKGKN